jgi:hypothetical protein
LLLVDPVVVEPPGMADGAAKGDDAKTEQRTSDPFSLGLQIVGPVPDLSDAAGVSIGEA